MKLLENAVMTGKAGSPWAGTVMREAGTGIRKEWGTASTLP